MVVYGVFCLMKDLFEGDFITLKDENEFDDVVIELDVLLCVEYYCKKVECLFYLLNVGDLLKFLMDM